MAGVVELRSHGQLGLAPLQWPATYHGVDDHPCSRRSICCYGRWTRSSWRGCGRRTTPAPRSSRPAAGHGGAERGAERGAELLHLQLEPAGVALVAGDVVLGADGGEGAADREARQQEVAMGIGGGMGKEESVG